MLWLLIKEPDFKVLSQYSWEIVARRPFKLGRIERKVTARPEPSKKARIHQSGKHASSGKTTRLQNVAVRGWLVVMSIVTPMSPRLLRTAIPPAPLRRHPVMVRLTPLISLHPKKLTAWRCIGGTGIP